MDTLITTVYGDGPDADLIRAMQRYVTGIKDTATPVRMRALRAASCLIRGASVDSVARAEGYTPTRDAARGA